MQLSLDSLVLWQRGPVLLNATILYTWLVMVLLVLVLVGDPQAIHRRPNLPLAKPAGGPGGER